MGWALLHLHLPSFLSLVPLLSCVQMWMRVEINVAQVKRAERGTPPLHSSLLAHIQISSSVSIETIQCQHLILPPFFILQFSHLEITFMYIYVPLPPFHHWDHCQKAFWHLLTAFNIFFYVVSINHSKLRQPMKFPCSKFDNTLAHLSSYLIF